jgi:hypothetical protein
MRRSMAQTTKILRNRSVKTFLLSSLR